MLLTHMLQHGAALFVAVLLATLVQIEAALTYESLDLDGDGCITRDEFPEERLVPQESSKDWEKKFEQCADKCWQEVHGVHTAGAKFDGAALGNHTKDMAGIRPPLTTMQASLLAHILHLENQLVAAADRHKKELRALKDVKLAGAPRSLSFGLVDEAAEEPTADTSTAAPAAAAEAAGQRAGASVEAAQRPQSGPPAEGDIEGVRRRRRGVGLGLLGRTRGLRQEGRTRARLPRVAGAEDHDEPIAPHDEEHHELSSATPRHLAEDDHAGVSTPPLAHSDVTVEDRMASPWYKRRCLADGFAPEQRRSLPPGTFGGPGAVRNITLSIDSCCWAAVELPAWIAKIILEDALGLHVNWGQVHSYAPAYLSLAGCVDAKDSTCSDLSRIQDPVTHVALGAWVTDVESEVRDILDTSGPKPMFKEVQDLIVNMGPIGFPVENMDFLMTDVVEDAQASLGLDLTWGPDLHKGVRFFTALENMNTSLGLYQNCEGWRDYASILEHRGYACDVSLIGTNPWRRSDGSFPTRPQPAFECPLPPLGKGGATFFGWSCVHDGWWASPACTELGGDPAKECIVYLDWGVGSSWASNVVSTWESLKIPVLYAYVGSWDAIVDIGRDYALNGNRMMFNWRSPDATFALQSAGASTKYRVRTLSMNYPPSMVPSSNSPYTLARQELTLHAPEVAMLLSRMRITRGQMDEMSARLPAFSEAHGLPYGLAQEEAFFNITCEWVLKYRFPAEVREEGIIAWSDWLMTAEDCPPGSTFNAETLSCSECLAGQTATGGAACRACKAGRFCPTAGTGVPSICTVGSYCPSGSSLPQVCDPGYFANETGRSACLPCPAGYQCGSSGLVDPIPCPTGSFAKGPLGTTCEQCDAGTYSADTASTSCFSCTPETSARPDLWMSLVRLKGIRTFTPVQGATSKEACGCTASGYLLDGDCVPCGLGMACFGKDDMELLPGYFASADRPSFVWRCYSDPLRCPGGRPGTCASNRENTSLACTSCIAGTTPAGDGSCKACSGADNVRTVLMCWLLFSALCVVYYVADMEDGATQGKAGLLIWLSIGQMFVLFQQLSVLLEIGVNWPRPLSDLLSILTVVDFDLSSDCIVPLSPLGRFASRVIVVFGIFTQLLVIHITVVGIGSTWRVWRVRATTLCDSMGTTFMHLLLAIVSGMAGPLQCMDHPNGLSTMRGEDAVVCWNDEFGSDHQAMVPFSIAACLIPMAVLAVATLAVLRLPGKLRSGDTEFLRKHSFLFKRFRLDCHWYVLPFLAKSVVVALIPVLSGPTLQFSTLSAVVLTTFCVSSHLAPWRISEGNDLDSFLGAVFLMVLISGALLVERTDGKTMGIFAVVIMIVGIVGILNMVALSVYLRFLRRGKPYQFFICHHKVAAGNLARLLKIHLLEHKKVHRNVFVDSDDLQDLNMLFTYIKDDLETLIVLCTKDVLQRPWCLGEVTTAFLNKLRVVRVALPDFTPLDDAAIIAAGQNMITSDIQLLAEHGMSVAMVQDALTWFFTVSNIDMPSIVSNESILALANDLVFQGLIQEKSGQLNIDSSVVSSVQSRSAFILADQTSMEASCTACIVQKLLMPLLIADKREGMVLHILMPTSVLPTSARQVVVVCTNGIFEHLSVVDALIAAGEVCADLIPIVCESSFVFPTTAFYTELRQVITKATGGGVLKAEVLAKTVQGLFTEIAIEVNPQDSELVLRIRIQALASRLFVASRAQEQHSPRRLVDSSESWSSRPSRSPGAASPSGRSIPLGLPQLDLPAAAPSAGSSASAAGSSSGDGGGGSGGVDKGDFDEQLIQEI